MLAPPLRQALLGLSANERARLPARRALRGLSGFVGALKAKYADIEVGLDLPPEPGLADNGDLEQDLTSLFEAIGAAAREARSTVAMFIDELQEWGKHAWEAAEASPIGVDDVERGSVLALAALDEGFFRVRFDRLTPAEKRYLRAMAELGAGPHRSGDIAAVLRKQSPSLGPTRSKSISKGMAWSPNHGDTAFTVPLFDQFMVRAVPGDDWRSA